MKKHTFIRFYHHVAHYYIIISQNTSVPMIGHLELAIGTGTRTSHASWVWFRKTCPWRLGVSICHKWTIISCHV